MGEDYETKAGEKGWKEELKRRKLEERGGQCKMKRARKEG